MKKNLKLISAKYVGGYNDTTIFDVLINYYDELVHIDVEVHSHDMQVPERTWQVITDKNINYKERKEIIESIIKDKPIYLADVEPKYYNKEINVSEELKTLQGWYESNYEMLTDYLRLGDEVDKELLNHLIDELPPKTLTGEMIQIGGAYSVDKNGRATYITFSRDVPLGDWFYRGACTLGSIMNEERKFEEFDMSYIEKDLKQEINNKKEQICYTEISERVPEDKRDKNLFYYEYRSNGGETTIEKKVVVDFSGTLVTNKDILGDKEYIKFQDLFKDSKYNCLDDSNIHDRVMESLGNELDEDNEMEE